MHLEVPAACTSLGPKDVGTALEVNGSGRFWAFDRLPRNPYLAKF